jgi:hypothetical protein
MSVSPESRPGSLSHAAVVIAATAALAVAGCGGDNESTTAPGANGAGSVHQSTDTTTAKPPAAPATTTSKTPTAPKSATTPSNGAPDSGISTRPGGPGGSSGY